MPHDFNLLKNVILFVVREPEGVRAGERETACQRGQGSRGNGRRRDGKELFCARASESTSQRNIPHVKSTRKDTSTAECEADQEQRAQ